MITSGTRINTPTHDGYVFSMSIRGAEKSIKDYVLEQEGYEWLGTEYKRKSRKSPRTIQVSSVSGKKIKKQVNEKQVVFWSEKYAKRAKAEREAALTKARDLAKNPGNYTRATSYGAAKYVKKVDYDKETGKIRADLICLADEVFDPEKDMIIFDPMATWKKTKIEGGTYTLRELLVPVFKKGECVYTSPSVMEIRDICQKEKQTLWGETLRLVNPQEVYVDLSDKLYKIKSDLLEEMSQAAIKNE